MKTALDALWAKADAYEGMKTKGWARMVDGYVESSLGLRADTAASMDPVDVTGAGMTARLTRDIDLAEVFYVSPEMNALVTAAAESWEEDECIWMEDFPSPVGWMWIPGGLTRLDIRGALATTDAVSWHVTGGKVVVTFWTDKVHDSPDLKSNPAWVDLPRLTPWHTAQQSLGKPLYYALQMGTLLPPEISNQIKFVSGPDGSQAAVFPIGWDMTEMRLEARPDAVVAWLVSALRIMQTEIADVRRQGLPANLRKALLKRPHRFKQKAVTVIEYRRRKGEFVGSEEREFSHRWLRRGHWRKQWYGSEKTGDRRQVRIWIHPTICGPEDKPVILRQHVNALTR